jgi:hypothetical protein
MINDRLILIGVAALSAVATAGWVRQTPAVMPQATNFNAPMALEADYALPATSASFAQPVQVAARRVSDNRYGMRTRPVQRVYDDRRDDRRVYDDRPVSQPRSKAKSAAIIGGSAAAGAAIGAMAGGGKGAAIGAITGGAGGLVYDQVTRRKNDDAYRNTDTYRSNGAVYDDQPYRNERSTKERIAIIGGSAAAGAAIGGIAGGGKGAAIGALGGGAAGYVYDRMTKNR